MSQKIMVVDDSDFMRNLLKQILEEKHSVVGEAENGADAVQKYFDLDPDITMMDIVMPVKTGIEATAEIKKRDSSAKIIMCTSVGQEKKMEKAIQAGADGYITKPFQKPSVMEAINDVVSN
ncbi:chemotaxis protein CheY [Methanonatronarchaeum sp. AMET-Sl]|uniref:chemotaxis protein CheY n=1 Tax=Methanonatronarchaeum sp. AMET-Sl TaxID=3037654 RepID=UPI00244DDA78|nr:chemotaxis protein CheY [Methanonatronarchaeum sp. AMET-Sl]WGI17827.1 chemotaxis protein CheY [Methanonatronarchaeum sp. AMET-Sl]